MPNPGKASRVLLFARQGRKLWPDLGESWTMQVRGFDEVDPECPFWRNGRGKFLRILKAYINAINDKMTDEVARRALLSDLGFVLTDDFVRPGEEESLLDYWRPNGPEFRQGSNEQHTNRRFFHYGPILPKQSFGTTRSTLNAIPGRFGAIPRVVEDICLRERIRAAIADSGDRPVDLDQLYVNYYSAVAKGRIGYHHDHPGTMHGVIAGISLKSSCEFHLLALDPELASQPTLFLRLPVRSMYLMGGLSRYHLQHGLPAVAEDRLSLTFRSVDRAGVGGSRKLWAREWSELPAAEAAKCHWPLLPPPPTEEEAGRR